MSRPPDARTVQREFAQLTLLCITAVALFVVTRAFATSNRQLRAHDAAMWFNTAQQQLASGAIERAMDDLRQAVVLHPAQASYRLAFADALAQARRDRDAQAVLTALRATNPEDAAVNLRLARLEARTGAVDPSVRYYETALAALWPEADSAQRRAVRIELVEFLLSQRRQGRALHPDHPLDVVVDRLADSQGWLPVVNRDNAQEVVGVITLDSLWRHVATNPEADENA